MSLERLLMLAVLTGLPGAVCAQAGPRVNDCTLLTDPTLMHQCIEAARTGQTGRAPKTFAPDAFAPRSPVQPSADAGRPARKGTAARPQRLEAERGGPATQANKGTKETAPAGPGTRIP